jgi:hypothetical protein
MRAFLSAVLMAALLMPFGLRPASAQASEALAEVMDQCRRDAADLCSDVEPGGLRVAACLYSRLNDLSPPCRRAMRDGIAIRACGGEYHRYCSDVPIGYGKVARCLRQFSDSVGPRCAEALAMGRPRFAERHYGGKWEEEAAPAPKALPYTRKYTEESYTRRRYREETAPEDYEDDQGPDDLK